MLQYLGVFNMKLINKNEIKSVSGGDLCECVSVNPGRPRVLWDMPTEQSCNEYCCDYSIMIFRSLFRGRYTSCDFIRQVSSNILI